MGLIRNLLALIGLLAILGGGYLAVLARPVVEQLGLSPQELFSLPQRFDPKAGEVYLGMTKRLLASMNPAEASVWKMPLKEGVSIEDATQAIRAVANEHNIKNVGELPLSEQVQAMTGKPQRYLHIFMFCNPLTAMQMIEHSDAYAAFLPCRVALLADKTGKYWLVALDMDMMIWGGASLPPALHKEAVEVRRIILDIMARGAKGEF